MGVEGMKRKRVPAVESIKRGMGHVVCLHVFFRTPPRQPSGIVKTPYFF